MTFEHRQSTKHIYMPDTSSTGVAMFDYDADGFQDVFLLQGSGPERTHDPAKMPPSHLYRVSPGKDGSDPVLEEIAELASAGSRGWGQGCLALDFDNDGYEDLLLSHYQEPMRLLRNNGDGTFREVAHQLKIDGSELAWASCLATLDYNVDGWLDVYVGQYLRFEGDAWVKDPALEHDGEQMVEKTLIPGRYPPLTKVLYRNHQGVGFEDVTKPMGVADADTRTYGIVTSDFDMDGWPDIFIANDATPCSLYRNEKGRGFSNQSGAAWIAENRGSMGIALGDVNFDGSMDLIVTHWKNPPALYRNFVGRQGAKKLRFLDRAQQYGLIEAEPLIGWATGFVDVDNDGLEDLLQINGHTNPDDKRPGKIQQQPAYLWKMSQDAAGGHFTLIKPAPGDPIGAKRVGRGGAFGDLDNDGFVDVVLGNNNEPGELWMAQRTSNAWIGLHLVGTAGNRDAYNAYVTLTQGKRVRRKELVSGQSFYSSNALPLLFGLGADEAPVSCRVRWPSGRVEDFEGLAPRRYHRFVEGDGRVVAGS